MSPKPAFLLAAALATGSCCTDPVDQSQYFCLGEMSREEEMQLGASYAPNIDGMYDGVYPDADADDYLRSLVVEMAGHSVYGPDYPWKFTILNTSMPNAFAVPGGYVYITRGLLAAMETEGQFISVMGHELGHVEHRHSHRAMGRSTLGGIVVGILGTAESMLTESEEPGVVATVGSAGAGLVLLSFDRDQELQSDKRGVYYAAEMGYDPTEAVKTFEYFQQLEDASGSAQIEWLRTHPLNENRISDIRAEIQARYPELADKPQASFRPYVKGNRRFEEIASRIAGVQPLYDRYDQAIATLQQAITDEDEDGIESALDELEDVADERPAEPLFHMGVGWARLALGEHGKARAALEQAIQQDDAYLSDRKLWRAHFLLGAVAFETSQFEQARDEFALAADVYPTNPSLFYYLGESEERLDHDPEAIAAYQAVIQLEGDPNGPLTQKATERLQALGN